MNRRTFLPAIGSAAVLAPFVSSAQSAPRRKVGVIGHTGRGDYGHGLDTVWKRIPEVAIVGVADADPAGLAKEMEKLALPQDRGFTDYRKMLEAVKPEFVAVCTRHVDQHRDMCLAAIEAGAKGIYVEKPFCRTPAEADELKAACKAHGARIAVAHRNRYHPVLPVIDQWIADGGIGKVLEIRGRGKGDRRGGAEDLWVLGSHVLNLIHFFAGDPKSCSAVMLQDGVPVTGANVVDGAEGLGPLAGNEVHARYEMAEGVLACFDSIADDGTGGAGFGLQLIGSEGIVAIHCDREPLAHLVRGNPFQPTGTPQPWIPVTSAGVGKEETNPDLIAAVQHHDAAVRDLIDACDSGREPLCGLGEASVTVEMICAVFASHRGEGKAERWPLIERGNALSMLAG